MFYQYIIEIRKKILKFNCNVYNLAPDSIRIGFIIAQEN